MPWLVPRSYRQRKCFETLQAYYRVYKENIPVPQLCRETAAVMQEFTRKEVFNVSAAAVTDSLMTRILLISCVFIPLLDAVQGLLIRNRGVGELLLSFHCGYLWQKKHEGYNR